MYRHTPAAEVAHLEQAFHSRMSRRCRSVLHGAALRCGACGGALLLVEHQDAGVVQDVIEQARLSPWLPLHGPATRSRLLTSSHPPTCTGWWPHSNMYGLIGVP